MQTAFNKNVHKIISNGVTIDWTVDPRQAESSFKETIGTKEWWVIRPDGSATLQAKG